MSPQFGQVIPTDPLKAQPYRTQRAELPEDLKICQGPSLKNSVNSGKAVMLIPNQVLLRRKGVEAVYGADFRSEEMAHSLANEKLKKMAGNREPKIQRLKNLVNSVDPKILRNGNHGNTEPSSTQSREGVEIIKGELKLENSPVKVARKLILGTSLGDGNIESRKHFKKKARLRFSHCEAQGSYFLWKLDKLRPLLGEFRVAKRVKKGFSNGIKWFACSKISKYLFHIWKDIYSLETGRPKKKIRMNVLNRLTSISIATWYMDDGCLVRVKRNGSFEVGAIRLATSGFAESGINLIRKFFKSKFGIEFNKLKSNSISAKGESARKFLSIVYSYVKEVPCLQYKINPELRSPLFRTRDSKEDLSHDIIRASRKLEEMIRNNHPPN